MARKIGIGNQDFEVVREKGILIPHGERPLNISMVEKFFSVNYADRGDLFKGLNIWEEKSSAGEYKYRKLQGTYPVIFLSFADVKETTFEEARKKIIKIIQLV